MSPPPYSFPGATPQVSGGGQYEHFFRTAYDANTQKKTPFFEGAPPVDGSK